MTRDVVRHAGAHYVRARDFTCKAVFALLRNQVLRHQRNSSSTTAKQPNESLPAALCRLRNHKCPPPDRQHQQVQSTCGVMTQHPDWVLTHWNLPMDGRPFRPGQPHVRRRLWIGYPIHNAT
eukprot:scaffold301_cov370-Pavlova_lutheri.AAC.32